MKGLVKKVVQFFMISLNPGAPLGQSASIYYHDVVVGNGESFDRISLEKFDEQMRYLSSQGYVSLVFSDLDRKADFGEKSVLITFDDGYLSNFSLVYPVMKKYGLKFNIFLEVGAVEIHENYLKWCMIKEMSESGLVEFGAHTFSHIDARYIDAANFGREIDLANRLIEENAGRGVSDFCFPFGAYDRPVANQLARMANYKRLHTSDGRRSTCLGSKALVGRVGIAQEDTQEVFIQKLNGRFDLYYRTLRLVKRALGAGAKRHSRH